MFLFLVQTHTCDDPKTETGLLLRIDKIQGHSTWSLDPFANQVYSNTRGLSSRKMNLNRGAFSRSYHSSSKHGLMNNVCYLLNLCTQLTFGQETPWRRNGSKYCRYVHNVFGFGYKFYFIWFLKQLHVREWVLIFFQKRFWRTSALFVGPLIPMFCTSGGSPHLGASSPARKEFLRLTSGFHI